jgi:hypothetical protein
MSAEASLHAERRVKYKGTARVALHHLHFDNHGRRELNRKNVDRLIEIFRTESVLRLEPQHHIPAVIDPTLLDDVIQASGLSAESLLNNPDQNLPALKLPQQFRLTCLHGQHRIQAAREILPPTDAWWVVDLYLVGMHNVALVPGGNLTHSLHRCQP